jgi:hypothetical protein
MSCAVCGGRAEFLEGMANDKGTWPKQRAP